MWGDGMTIMGLLTISMLGLIGFALVDYVNLPVVQINTEGKCVQVLFTDEFGCGFLPDKYIVEHVQ